VVFNAIKNGTVNSRTNTASARMPGARAARRRAKARPCSPSSTAVSVDDLLHGAIIQSGNDSCIALAEGMAENRRIFAADFMTKRARGSA
jgi:D-alanyl-D-alanine carboxypeptidase (penicillin-binding protein 5/6)